MCLLFTGFLLALGCKTDRAKTDGGLPSSTKRVYSREKPDSNEEGKQGYEGGDPDIFHPPVHPGAAHETVEQNAHASTPTPTPNRPIDRPLDPSGKPLTSPTPEG